MMDDEGQAYIATGVALAALVAAAFAAPAITHSSLSGGTQAAATSRATFMDEVDDVLRVVESHVNQTDLQVFVTCQLGTTQVPIPDQPGNFTEEPSWNCPDEGEPCAEFALERAFRDGLIQTRPLVRVAIDAWSETRPGCDARCEDSITVPPECSADDAAINASFRFVASTASAFFNLPVFGGNRTVTVICQQTSGPAPPTPCGP